MPDEMQVNVKHFLSAFFADVELELIANEAGLLSEFLRGDHEMTKERLLRFGGVGNGSNVLTWNDEKMRFVFWMDVCEGDTLFVFIDDRGWDFLGNNFTKETVGHGVGFYDVSKKSSSLV